MFSEVNKTVVCRFFDVLNQQNPTVLDALAASDYDSTLQRRGLIQLTQSVTLLHRAFPDLRETVEDSTAEGDAVWVRYTVTGTHPSEYRGLSPTGKTFTLAAVSIYPLVNGEIVERTTVHNFVDFYTDLGVRDYTGFPDATT